MGIIAGSRKQKENNFNEIDVLLWLVCELNHEQSVGNHILGNVINLANILML